MNDFNISFLAGLDKNRSKENLNQDIDTIKKSLKELELKVKLDPNQIKTLENQLNTLKINLSDVSISQNALNGLVSQINNSLKEIKISNISVSNDTSKTQQVGQQIGNNITQGLTQEFSKSDDVINNFKKSLSNAGKDSSEIDNIVEKVKSLNVQIDSLKFNETTDGLMKIDVSGLDEFGNKVKITQSLLQDLQTMDLNVANTTTSVISTKELDKINNAFSDYTAKLAQFKSTNSEILSGLTIPLTDFENKLLGLKNGTSTIDEVTNAYKLLNAEASNITKNFSRQLSPIDSAIRNLAKGEETISGLRAEFKGLNNAPKEINSELNRCARLLENIKKIEAQEGRTENWSQAYRQWSNSVDVLQAKLKMLRKEQSNVASTQVFKISDLKDNDIAYMSKVYNTIEKQMVEINRMANTKGWKIIDISGVEQADGLIKNLTLTITDAEGALKRLTMQREKLQGNGKAQYGLMQVGDVKVIETASQAQEKLAQSTEKANAKLVEQINKIQLSLGANGDITAQIEVLRNNFSKLGMSADEVETKMNGVDTEVQQLKTLMSSGADNSAIVSQFDRLQTALTQTQNNLKTTRSEYSLLATEQQRLSLANTIEAWNQKNTAATKGVREENDRYVLSLRDLNTQMTKVQFSQIQTSFKKTENLMRGLDKLGASFSNQMKQAASSFTTWLSASTLIMKAISETREAISNIKELDNTLTEISKTSDMTAESLEKLGMSSYDTASDYGRTSSDYLSAYESMARSGFYDEVGQEMSELSLLAQAAGDMSQEVADAYIIATNAAYKYNGDVQKLNGVLDGMNLITNRNSVALEDMASAMSEAGTTAAAYNVNVEDLSAMIGTMEAVTKSGGGEIGNSLKSILINLQNVTSDKITTTLNKANASMTEMVDGAEKLRNPIEILRDLSSTFNELDEKDPLRAEILTNIGGKYQATKLAALLQNMELFDKMLVDYSEGSGSAMEEASKSANNLEGRLNALSNSWYKFVNSLVKSDDLKMVVNFINSLIQGVTEFTSTLGSVGTIGLGAGLFAGIKKIGREKCYPSLNMPIVI